MSDEKPWYKRATWGVWYDRPLRVTLAMAEDRDMAIRIVEQRRFDREGKRLSWRMDGVLPDPISPEEAEAWLTRRRK